MNLLFVILTFLIAVGIARLIIPRILLISVRKRLYDIPDARKVHTRAIPRLGGVSFYPAALVAYCLVYAVRLLVGSSIAPVYASYLLVEMLLYVCGMMMLYLTGIADDLVGVRYRQKFVIQILCGCLFPLSNLWINDLYGLFGIHELPAYIGMPLTVFVVVFITNAINLIDGIDGLASGLSSMALAVMALLFMLKGMCSYSMLAVAMLGVLVPFFFYNVFGSADRARKIFMGDTGSLTLGYTICFLAIKYCQNNPEVAPYTRHAFFIVFSTLIIPAFDVVRVVLVRFRRHQPLFEPDRNHIHHKLLAIGYTSKQAMMILLALALLFSGSNILLVRWGVNSSLLLVADVILWIGLHLRWNYLIEKKKKPLAQ